MSTGITLQGEHGRLQVRPDGGMLGPGEFIVPGGGRIRPLTCPEWQRRPDADALIPMIRRLCGDFMCAPFGAPEPAETLPAHWRKGAGPGMPEDPWFHGYCANSRWDVTGDADDPTWATMTILPPEPHPLSRVVRRVSLLADAPGYQVELRITARRDVRFPLALHPCFYLPAEAGAMRVEIPNAGRGWTYPIPLLPSNAPIAANARFDNLNAVPRTDGGMMDLTRLPPPERFEALLQIPAPDGEMRLIYEQAGYAVRFFYDAELLPSLMIWISNQGRDEAPFDGEFRTVGIEAVAGAFDLGPAVSNWSDNPIAREGISTTVSLLANQELTTTSTVTLQAL